MDLVDIDKVLDDLELNENKHDAVFSQETAVGNRDDDENDQQSDEAGLLAVSATSQLATETNTVVNKSTTKTKNFVNITNVFSSLNEYVNVDIERSIRTDEPPPPQKLHDYEVNIIQRSSLGETVDNNKRDDDEEDCTDDLPDDQNDGAITSASSITTSSPSSFSSGPSPGSSSSESSSSGSFPSGPAKFNSVRKPENSTNQTNSTTVCGNWETNGSFVATRPWIVANQIDSKVPISAAIADEDVAIDRSCELGLSSISSYLYNENTSSSFPGLSTDLCKVDTLSFMSSSTPKDSDEQSSNFHEINGKSQQASGKPIESPQSIEAAPNPSVVLENGTSEPPKKQHVVGFGSTVDEISDTELDSILQEIDSDLQVFGETTTTGVLETIATNPTVERPSEAEKTTTSSEQSLDPRKLLSTEPHDEDNAANADNFSQASTVEFAESRIHTDFDQDAATVGSIATASIGHHDEVQNEVIAGYEEVSAIAAAATTSTAEVVCDTLKSNEEASMTQPKTLPQRPNSLDLPVITLNVNSNAGQTPPAAMLADETTGISNSSIDEISPQSYNQIMTEATTSAAIVTEAAAAAGDTKLGKIPPFWIPDSEAPVCMQCQMKFSLLKRRHHCRACGLVLCSTCCSQKAKLEFLGDNEVRVCVQCHLILKEHFNSADTDQQPTDGSIRSNDNGAGGGVLNRPPNPNNPMEYCSVIPPHQQVTGGAGATANSISVMVPVGVLKREGVPPKNNRKDKNVIFSDGIRPGCDLAELDDSWDDKGDNGSGGSRKSGSNRRVQTPSVLSSPSHSAVNQRSKVLTSNFGESDCFLPDGPNELPPIYMKNLSETELVEVTNNAQLITRLSTETLQFALQRNLYVYVKIVKLKCCVNKTVINFTTRGMHHVGQDEIVILLEYDDSDQNRVKLLPKDIFVHLNQIYREAYKGRAIPELGFSVQNSSNFLGSPDHGGFLYIRPTFQCLLEIQLPDAPFLIGILIHRWEIPWARVFPLRLMLRLGAQYRYYPSPHVSIANREPVYAEIAQTIINFLADFRNYSYTLATIRGMYIHMEDRKTTVLIPHNRYDQIVKTLNNSSDHILALGANFSKKADGHLVCIQNMESNCPETHTYSTQAINIQGQPRKVTGASFFVLNGALKSTSGLSGKCSIVEDGLMVQILPTKMTQIRAALQNQENIEIVCGPVDADEAQTEIVSILWTDDDTEFNIGVKSPIDGMKMDGIPSIRVHSGLNYSNASHIIRWTEVFIIQSDNVTSSQDKETNKISSISEQIAKSTSTALVSFLDLLAASGYVKIGLRATLHQDNVCYETGALNSKLPPLYMNALDNELIPTLHRQASNLNTTEKSLILELIFHILDK